MKAERLVRFASLFGGRTDAYFVSLAKGGRAMRSPVTLQLFARHLSGIEEIGTYPVTDSACCRWGCIDIDIPTVDKAAEGGTDIDDVSTRDAKALERAKDVQTAWHFFGVTAWIERSRSKGYHVWTFADRWIAASDMRHAGQYVARLVELNPKTEVNPKNDAPWLVPNGLVNTVRTPYSGRAEPNRMTIIDDQGGAIDVETFTREALAKRAGATILHSLAADYRSIARRESARQGADQVGCRPLVDRVRPHGRGLSQSVAAILDGTARAQVGERDNQFYAMAKYLHGTQTPYDIARHIVERKWREMADATDFPLEIALSKVERVYR